MILLKLICDQGVDFDNKEKNISWLNLSFYDYKATNIDILFDSKVNNKENESLSARCLIKNQQSGKYFYAKGKI